MADDYATQAKGIRILPGMWRPHYPWEQIAWVSPPWPSQDYVWLDFPEAIFTDSGLLFLSHINPPFPVLFPNPPKVPWEQSENGISFERVLPNGIAFGGSVERWDGVGARLTLFIRNGSDTPLVRIKLQTCAYLRGIKEFAEFTQANKLVHVPGRGWMPFNEAHATGTETEQFSLGWRSGPNSADLPVMATVSGETGRVAAMTWFESTNALVGNPGHPCMHADPVFPDLAPGARTDIRGALMFFDGTVDAFGEWFVSEGMKG